MSIPSRSALALAVLLVTAVEASARQRAPRPVQLSATSGTVRRGEFGGDVAVVGDLDGDGVDEWMAGRTGPVFGNEPPELRVYSGGTGALLYALEGLGPIDGIFLESFADLGDVDGDGVTDFAFANANAPRNGSPNIGAVVVYSGATGAELYTRWGLRTFGGFGASLAPFHPGPGGDVDGDGVSDYVVGAIGTLDENAWVISGARGSVLLRVRVPGGLGDIEFGWAVATLGDADGDGRADLAVGTRTGGFVDAYSSVTGERLFRAVGGTSFGRRLARVGDVDRDGLDDLLVGEPDANAVHLLSGRDGRALLVLVASDGASFGTAIAAAGDVDRDRVPDFVVGDDGFGASRGRAQVFSGRTGRVLFEVVGGRANERLGASVAGGANLDGNAFPDLVIGAPGAFRPGRDAGDVTTWSGWRASASAHGRGR